MANFINIHLSAMPPRQTNVRKNGVFKF
jgi:hypothetical protein